MVHQSFERAAGSVPAAGGRQGWTLPPHQPHPVPLSPDELELLSAATKTQTTLHVGDFVLGS